MNKTIVAALTGVVLFAPAAAQAQTSISCMYMLLRVYHAELDYCKVSLPIEREDRYKRLRANFERYIRANAKVDAERLITGIAEKEKQAISGLKSCQTDDFKLARQAIDQMTDFSNEKTVNDNLQIKRDPQTGTCG